MGKREIGQLSIQDLVVSLLIAELCAIAIENSKDSSVKAGLSLYVYENEKSEEFIENFYNNIYGYRKFIIDYQTHTHKLKLETINYKNIGIIKEEDNESSSESLSHTDRNQEKCLTMSDYTIKKVYRKTKEKLGELDIYKTNDINDDL